MKPIIIKTSDEQFTQSSFREYLLSLCEKHKKEGRALAFAFIVYDFEDNTIQEILGNERYWMSLDKISGKYLTIFYINSENSYLEKRLEEIYFDELSESSSNDGIMHNMRQIYSRSTPLDQTINFLKDEFGISEYIKHPFVIFFQSDGEKLLDSFVVALNDQKLEDSFLELKFHIKNAVDSVSIVSKENYNNHQEIFNLIKSDVKNGKTLRFIKTKIVPKFGTVFSLVKTILTGF